MVSLIYASVGLLIGLIITLVLLLGTMRLHKPMDIPEDLWEEFEKQ